MLLVSPGNTVSTQLDAFVTDANGFPVNPEVIGYGIYYRDGSELVLVSGSADMPPQSDAVGHFFPNWLVPANAQLGSYRIIWTVQQSALLPAEQIVQDFSVGSAATMVSPYSANARTLLKWLRTTLRDGNPDRHYSFRPPAPEHLRDGVTHHFGYIWEDEELYIFLEMGVSAINYAPPQSSMTLDSLRDALKYPVVIAAAALALNAVAMNWVADEFDYSIGGKSLTIEKSSKYQALGQQMEEKLQQVLEQKKTLRHVAGLAQINTGMTVFGGGSGQRVSATAVRHAISYISPWL